MKNKYLLIILIIVISCQRGVVNREINRVESYPENIFYKLEILNDDDTNSYQVDNYGRCSVLINRSTYINDKYFGSFEDVYKAVKIANNEKESGKRNEIILRTTIGIKNKKNVYEEIWIFDNDVSVTKNDPQCKDCFGFYESKLELEDGITSYQNKTVYCLKIIFKEIDDGEGAKTRTFFYTKNDDVWRLIKRATLNTKAKTYVEQEFEKDYTDHECNYGNVDNRIKISVACLVD